MSDPLSDTHATIWTVLEAYSGFTSLVPAANRFKNATVKRGELDNFPRDTHHPAVAVLLDDGMFDPDMNSSGSQFRVNWHLVYTHADERLETKYLPLMWAFVRAIMGQERSISTIRALTFSGEYYNKDVRLKDFRASYSFQGMLDEAQQTTKRWRGVWTLETHMMFTSSNLYPS